MKSDAGHRKIATTLAFLTTLILAISISNSFAENSQNLPAKSEISHPPGAGWSITDDKFDFSNAYKIDSIYFHEPIAQPIVPFPSKLTQHLEKKKDLLVQTLENPYFQFSTGYLRPLSMPSKGVIYLHGLGPAAISFYTDKNLYHDDYKNFFGINDGFPH